MCLGCDKSCGLTDDIDNLTTKEEVRELADKGGDIYALMEYAGPVCKFVFIIRSLYPSLSSLVLHFNK